MFRIVNVKGGLALKFYEQLSDCPYEVYHNVLNPHRIWNFLEIPPDLRKARQEFYDNLEASILKEGVRNPILVVKIKRYPPEKLRNKMKKNSSWRAYHSRHDFWWTNDEDEPIWLPRHKTPKKKIAPDGSMFVCRMLGGSRLLIAQKHNIKIPCIISDFCKDAATGKPLKSKKDIFQCFKDQPKAIGFGSYGVFQDVDNKKKD